VDIAFHAGAISADLASLFDALVFGIAQQIAVDQFPCLVAVSLDVAVEGRFLKTFLCDANPAKPAQAMRIDDMKGQFLIGEVEQNLDDSASQHLVGTHAVCTGSPGLCFASIQILQNFSQMVVVASMMVLIASSSLLWDDL